MSGHDLARAAAEISLAALESVVRDHREMLGFILLPEMRVLERSVMVRALADMPKPLLCVGVGLFGRLAIGCWGIQLKAWSRDDGEKRPNGGLDSASMVSVSSIARREPLIVTLGVVQEWSRGYEMPQIGFSIVEAASDVTAARARYALEFEPTELGPDTIGFLRGSR